MEQLEPRPKHQPRSRLYYGYVIVAASMLVMAMIWGTNYCFGIFFKPLVNEFGWARSMTAGAFSLAILVEGIGSLFASRLNDRFGARKVLTVTALLFGLGFFLMSGISSITHLYLVYGVLVGLALGGCYVPVMSTIAGWFNRRRGMMVAIVSASVSLGAMIMSPLANRLILGHGWRGSFVIFGVMAFIGITLGAQLLKKNPNPLTGPEVKAKEATPPAGNSNAQKFRYLKTFQPGQFWLLCFVLFSWAFCKYTILVHLAPHIIDSGISPTNAANVIALMGGSTFVATLTIGVGTFKIGTKQTFVISLSLMSAALFWLLKAQTLWSFYLFVVVFSFGFACGSVLLPTIIAEIFGLKSYGALLGIGNFSACIGCATGPVIAGHLFDTTGSYSLAFGLIAAMGVLNVVLILFLKVGKGAGQAKKVRQAEV